MFQNEVHPKLIEEINGKITTLQLNSEEREKREEGKSTRKGDRRRGGRGASRVRDPLHAGGAPGLRTPTVRLTERARMALHGPQETPERGQVSASSRRKEKGLPANPAGDTGANRVISGKAGSRTGGPQGQSGPDRVTTASSPGHVTHPHT